MKTISFCLIFTLIKVSSGAFFDKGSWDGLKGKSFWDYCNKVHDSISASVTWNFNPFANDAYSKMPQKTSDCSKSKFLLKDQFCQGM